jgi:hypothetical protein
MAGSHRSMQPEHVAPHWPSVGAEKDEDGRLVFMSRQRHVQSIAYISEQGNYLISLSSKAAMYIQELWHILVSHVPRSSYTSTIAKYTTTY